MLPEFQNRFFFDNSSFYYSYNNYNYNYYIIIIVSKLDLINNAFITICAINAGRTVYLGPVNPAWISHHSLEFHKPPAFNVVAISVHLSPPFNRY